MQEAFNAEAMAERFAADITLLQERRAALNTSRKLPLHPPSLQSMRREPGSKWSLEVTASGVELGARMKDSVKEFVYHTMIWEELGLPKLKPESPWFGYSLGEWSPEFDAAAERATRGDYLDNDKGLEARRRKDVRMNTEVRRVHEQKPRPGKKAPR